VAIEFLRDCFIALPRPPHSARLDLNQIPLVSIAAQYFSQGSVTFIVLKSRQNFRRFVRSEEKFNFACFRWVRVVPTSVEYLYSGEQQEYDDCYGQLFFHWSIRYSADVNVTFVVEYLFEVLLPGC